MSTRTCDHPEDKRIMTGKREIKCTVCGTYDPAGDLDRRQMKSDAAMGRAIRDKYPQATAEHILSILDSPAETPRAKTTKKRSR